MKAQSQSGSDDVAGSGFGSDDGPGPGSTPAVPSEKSGAAVVAARRPSIGVIRPGPGVIADDSWGEPALPVLARAIGRARRVRLPARVLVAATAVLIGLGAIVVVPLALRSQPDTLNRIVFPKHANYTKTVHYVQLTPQDDAGASVAVSGASSAWVDFAWNWSCCQTVAATINIPAGTRSLTLANSTGRMAWIDRIVITQAPGP